MKSFYSLFSMTLVAFLLTACSQSVPTTQLASHFINKQQITPTTHETYPAKNPHKVAFYGTDKDPHAAYRIIGVAKVSKTNMLGKKRHETALHDMMKELAASIGGDGLINVNHTPDSIEAHVIAFQKILI